MPFNSQTSYLTQNT